MPQLLLACDAMATRFELVLLGDDPVRLRAAGEEALDEIRLWHNRLSFFDPASFISHINAHAHARPVPCDPEVFALLALCRDIWSASRAAFDPTVAALMRASGFRDRPRDPAAIAAALAQTGMDKVLLDPAARTLRFTTPGVALDLGAIGKGFALDAAARILADAPVLAFLIHGGASSVLAGAAPDSSYPPWPITLGRFDPAPTLALRNTALGVSTPAGRTILDEASSSHGHVLDPRTGASSSALSLAAVIGPSAALADAWSTAALVHGSRPDACPPDYACITAEQIGHDLIWRTSGPTSSILSLPRSETSG